MSLSSNGAAIKREKHERTAVGGWPPPFSSLEELDGIRGIRGNLENRPSSSGFEDFTANSIILPDYFRDNTRTSDYPHNLCRFPTREMGSR